MKSELKLLLTKKNKQQSIKKINRSILNNSSSKQLPFFPKAERFPIKMHSSSQQKQLSQENRSQSSCSTTRGNKFPTIPQAERVLYFDQEKQLCLHPSPQTYNIKPNEELFKVTHKGGTMGARFNSVPSIKEATPSAMDYQKQDIPNKKSFNRSFTFDRSQRNLMNILTNKGKDSPGPKYDIVNHTKQKYIFPIFHARSQLKQKQAKNKVNKIKLAAFPREDRFTTIHLQSINRRDHQNVNEKKEMQRTERGHSVKRNIGFSTTRRQRIHTLPQKNPGPGSYIFFSEFSGWM